MLRQTKKKRNIATSHLPGLYLHSTMQTTVYTYFVIKSNAYVLSRAIFMHATIYEATITESLNAKKQTELGLK
jgi:hypothetical protein